MTRKDQLIVPPTLTAMTTLDRLSPLRSDNTRLEALMLSPQSRLLVLVGDKVVIRSDADRSEATLALFRLGELPGAAPDPNELLFLGVAPGTDAATFAIALKPEEAEQRDPDGLSFSPAVDLRSLAMQGVLSSGELSLAAAAQALANWKTASRFCGRCGGRMQSWDGGWKHVCTCCACQTFPRTDPVVIMLVTAGDKCVLGRQSQFPEGMYSALAGFLEPGETIESAVMRETEEEVGIVPVAVKYVASQPWPFPHSLMLGCVAEAAHAPLRVDPAELENARWFDRDEISIMLAGAHPDGLWVPRPHAIAAWLIHRFVEARD